MFLQAGFNPRMRRTGIVALVTANGWKGGHRRSNLAVHASGDLLWYGGEGRLSWGDNLHFRSFIHLPWSVFNPFEAKSFDLVTRLVT